MKKQSLLLVLLLSLLILCGCGRKEPTVEEVKVKMRKYLSEKYGEEFEVGTVGRRSWNKGSFYQASIKPKSIIGTSKEFDDYYYASSSIDILSDGSLGEPGDSYSFVYRNEDVEKYLMPKTKEIFGQRVLMKIDVKHKIGEDPLWLEYKSISLAEMRKDLKEEPNKNRIELKLYIYIFDRIDDEKEKEKRRKEIFDYVQYLKQEGLFEYLEMGVIFIDERVLAPSYKKYSRKIKVSKKEKVEVEGEKFYLPPMELRKEMSKVLEEELESMSEEKIISKMNKIKKEKLVFGKKSLGYYNRQHYSWVSSQGMLKIKDKARYNTEKKNGELKFYLYKKIDNIIIGKKNKRYMYQ